jgi:hypothetical protein
MVSSSEGVPSDMVCPVAPAGFRATDDQVGDGPCHATPVTFQRSPLSGRALTLLRCWSFPLAGQQRSGCEGGTLSMHLSMRWEVLLWRTMMTRHH